MMQMFALLSRLLSHSVCSKTLPMMQLATFVPSTNLGSVPSGPYPGCVTSLRESQSIRHELQLLGNRAHHLVY
ncbi:hypothetical protein BKA60DRAFT_566288 [Fusarium oxysporum]|nr:hypothetical protein BKA60DRAFT_566288 [Fusarium oxysporum]